MKPLKRAAETIRIRGGEPVGRSEGPSNEHYLSMDTELEQSVRSWRKRCHVQQASDVRAATGSSDEDTVLTISKE